MRTTKKVAGIFKIIVNISTTNQSSSPKVLLYGSRYESLLLGNWKEAIEMFVSDVLCVASM